MLLAILSWGPGAWSLRPGRWAAGPARTRLPWVAAVRSERRDSLLEALEAAVLEPALDEYESIAMVSALSVAWPLIPSSGGS